MTSDDPIEDKPVREYRPARRNRYSQRMLRANEKHVQALELRLAGHSFRTIAEQLGYSGHTGAINAVQAGMEKALLQPAEELRDLTYARLTRILQVWWPKMLQGDAQATKLVYEGIADIRSLMGLDKREPDGPGLAVNIDNRQAVIKVVYEEAAAEGAADMPQVTEAPDGNAHP